MCNSGYLGCGVGSGRSGGGVDVEVDDLVAEGPLVVLKPYFLPEWLNCPMYGDGGGGGGGGGGVGGGDGGGGVGGRSGGRFPW